ncbi:MAG TPA: glycosyltransferase [Bacteroidales bacterium]|nr:glycosyltransferase [Bacteroidales bacterium]
MIERLLNILNILFFAYACILFVVYVLTAILSMIELRMHTMKNEHSNFKKMLSFSKLPSVSVIAPAYNEGMTIVENIKCLLALEYQNFEIIIVNDGSKDDTLTKIIEHFDLIKVDKAFEYQVTCAPIRGIYKSTNAAYYQMLVIDKENGGKADALNSGINLAKNDLFLAIDVDCIIERDAIQKMVKPFMTDKKHIVVASGGVIRVANSCEVNEGKIVKVNYPDNFWAKFQVLEYFRAFTLGRMAWSKINGLLIISGAFGMFDRKRVINVGGYDKTTVGEDLELVVRLRRYMYEVEKRKHRVAFIPDPLCWTEVPETYKILYKQRNRWARGAIDTIMKHKKMFLNPNYGVIGMISFPYWVIFEWLAPIIQIIGIFYLLIVSILGILNVWICVLLLLFVFTFSVVYSLVAIFMESYTYSRYKGIKFISQAILFAIMEMFIYQPLNMYFSLSGNNDFFIKKNKKGWGEMTRTGFKQDKKNQK